MARPGFALRLIYALALLAPLPGMLALGSGWIALATGGGPAALLGGGVAVLAALALYRAGEALFIRRALDARQADGFPWVLRGVGIIAMTIGAACGVGLFAVKPLTLLVFHTAGDANIGFFAMALILGVWSQVGWPGVLLYEAGRFIGPPIDEEERGPSPSFKRRASILGAMLAAAIVLPLWMQAHAPTACGEHNLALCEATVEGSVKRMVVASPKMPVALDTAIDRIELRRMSGSSVKWSLIESPARSLVFAGLAQGEPDASVRLVIAARAEGKGVAMTFVVTEDGEETARFTTRFPHARLDGRRLLVDVPAHAEPGMRPAVPSGKSGEMASPDHVFVLMRRSIGNEIEAGELALRVDGEATRLQEDPGPYAGSLIDRGNPDKACADRISVRSSRISGPIPGLDAYNEVSFAAGPRARPHALSLRGTIACRGDAVWIVDYEAIRPEFSIRRYGLDGRLQRFVRATMPPPTHGDVGDYIDIGSITEAPGRLRFVRRYIDYGREIPREEAREAYEIAF